MLTFLNIFPLLTPGNYLRSHQPGRRKHLRGAASQDLLRRIPQPQPEVRQRPSPLRRLHRRVRWAERHRFQLVQRKHLQQSHRTSDFKLWTSNLEPWAGSRDRTQKDVGGCPSTSAHQPLRQTSLSTPTPSPQVFEAAQTHVAASSSRLFLHPNFRNNNLWRLYFIQVENHQNVKKG